VSRDPTPITRRLRRKAAASAWAWRSRERGYPGAEDRRLEQRMVLLAILAAILTVATQRWPGS